jgi:lipid II:glycine glycyltransferase (peptidoglycan interpeptide bridge formation enzyme)
VLQGARFVYEDHLNYLVDLGPTPEAVFSRIGKRTQRNIRHGLNQGHVEIVQVKTKDDLLICYSLLKKTYQNAKVPLAQSSLFEAAFDLLMPQGKCMVTLARVGGKPAAASFELIYKETLFGWYGGMDREFGSYVPNELLMWHILRWGSERSFNCYDFGGAGKPSEQYGVRDFKAKFGGELVCYGRNTWVPYPMVLKIGEFGYQRLRKNL